MLKINSLLISCTFIFYVGCTSSNTNHMVEPQKIYNTYKKVQNEPQELQDLYISYYLDEKRNSVLNLMQLGLYAFQKKYYKESGSIFDKVLLNIESTYKEDSASEKAKSLWYGEDSKRFIGEPYERSMAYYYRGLLYLKEKDYENARASFKGGILQDGRSEETQFQADFRTLLLLEALSSKLNGDNELYTDSVEELSNLSYNDNLAEEIDEANLFLFIESGNSPKKYTSGEYDSELNFSQDGYLITPKVSIKKIKNQKKITLLDDLYFQATTRGGREIEKIIDGKIAFKDDVNDTAVKSEKLASSSFKTSGAILSNYESTGNANADAAVALVSLTIAGIGLVAKGVSAVSETVASSVVTTADSRYWKNLPGGIYLYMDKLKPGKYAIEIQAETNSTINIEITQKNQIVIDQIFTNIVKPKGIVDMKQIDTVINEKDKYQNNYKNEKEKEESNEKLKTSIINFFTNK